MTPKEEQKHTDLPKYDLGQMEAFLCGEAPIDGLWFSDRHPTERGAYWWRKHLQAAIAQADTRKADCHEELAVRVIRQAIHEGFYNSDAGRDELAKKAAATIFGAFNKED